MGQETAQVSVASLRDASQPPLVAAGALSRGQTEVAREVASGREPKHVADEGHQGRCRQETDARDRAQPADGRDFFTQRFELTLGGLDSRLELGDLFAGFTEQRTQRYRNAALRVGKEGDDRGDDLLGAHRNRRSELRRPRRVLIRAVRVAIQLDRSRCSDVSDCWATLLSGTGRIASLREASSIALVSVRSVLLPSR